MSVEATAAVWAMKLKPTEKLVAVRIADHADPDGRNAYPSVRRVMEDTGLSERAVQGALVRLVERGVLTADGRGRHGTNRYTVNLSWTAPTPAAAAPLPPQEMPPAGGAPPQELPLNPAGAAGVPPQLLPPNRNKNHHRTVSDARRPEPGSDADPHFVAFWATYPLRKDKGAARKAWRAAIKRTDPEQIIAAAAVYATERAEADPKFTKYPASWLNAEAWSDEPPRTATARVGINGRPTI